MRGKAASVPCAIADAVCQGGLVRRFGPVRNDSLLRRAASQKATPLPVVSARFGLVRNDWHLVAGGEDAVFDAAVKKLGGKYYHKDDLGHPKSLGLVTLLAASVYEAWDAREALSSSYSLGVMLTGLLAAFGSAALAMRGLVSWVRERGLAVFGWYRVVLGVSVLAWLELSA